MQKMEFKYLYFRWYTFLGNDKIDVVLEILVNSINKDGKTPLHQAISKGDLYFFPDSHPIEITC